MKKIISLVLIFALSLNVFSPICNANYPDDVSAQIEELQQKLEELKQKQNDQQKVQQQQPIQVELKQYNPSFFERTGRIFKSGLSWLAGIGSLALVTGFGSILVKSIDSCANNDKCQNHEDFYNEFIKNANWKTFLEPIKFILRNVYFDVNM